MNCMHVARETFGAPCNIYGQGLQNQSKTAISTFSCCSSFSLSGKRWSSFGLILAQEGPGCSPKMRPDGAKRGPRWAKKRQEDEVPCSQIWAQDCHLEACIETTGSDTDLRWAKRSPKTPQDAPRWPLHWAFSYYAHLTRYYAAAKQKIKCFQLEPI